MAWMPGVDTTIRANDGNSQLACTPDVVCIHTIVGFAPATAAHFSTNAAGKVWQHRDTTRQSAANLNGNKHIIAIENEDRGPAFGNWDINDGHAVPGFTAQQIEAIAQICAWAYRTHGIPLVQCPDSRPGSKGIAYHRQGIPSPNNFAGYAYPGIVSGGEVWTTSKGKVCPGDRRISQIPQIISRGREIAGLGGDSFLSALSDTEQRNLYNRIFGMLRQRWYVQNNDGTISEVSSETANAVAATVLDSLDGNYIINRILDVDARISDLEEKVSQLASPQVEVDEVAIATAVAQQINLSGNIAPEQLRSVVEEAVLNVTKTQWNK